MQIERATKKANNGGVDHRRFVLIQEVNGSRQTATAIELICESVYVHENFSKGHAIPTVTIRFVHRDLCTNCFLSGELLKFHAREKIVRYKV